MSNLPPLPDITDLFSADVVTQVTAPHGCWEELPLEERQIVERAVPSRREAFAAGRIAARQLLRRLGIADQPIVADARRVPQWPAGTTGSISHSHSLCVVAMAKTDHLLALGIDTEPAEPLEGPTWNVIARPAELAWLQSLAPTEQGLWAKALFCIKEAVFKALFPRARDFVDFADVEVDINREAGTYLATLQRDLPAWTAGDRLHGKIVIRQGHIIAATEVRQLI